MSNRRRCRANQLLLWWLLSGGVAGCHVVPATAPLLQTQMLAGSLANGVESQSAPTAQESASHGTTSHESTRLPTQAADVAAPPPVLVWASDERVLESAEELPGVTSLETPRIEELKSPAGDRSEDPPATATATTTAVAPERPTTPSTSPDTDSKAAADFGHPTQSTADGETPAKLRGDSPVQLHLDNLDVRQALEILSREGPYNILVSEDVKGKVTANLDGLSFDRALAAIAKMANLVMHQEDDLVYVYSAQEYKRIQDEKQPVITKVYRLRFVRGSDIQEMCTPFLSPTVGRLSITPASEIGIGSDTTTVGGDSLAGGDAVVVQDYESVITAMDRIIAELDVQPTQVLIEAVIMEVSLENTQDLGANFGVLGAGDQLLAVAGNAMALNAGAGFDPARLLTAGGQINGNSMGALNDAHGIKFGFIDKDVTGFLRALNACGKTNVLATPRILVLNKQRAELIIGEKIGYKTLAITETSSVEKVEFLNVGTQLRLRPFIVENGLIRLEVHPERSSGFIKDGIPQTSTSEVTTNVMVPDGATIVIGGLIEDHEEVLHSGVPGLMDVPLLGVLFRRSSTVKAKKELIVLLTPRTWRPQPLSDIAQPPAEITAE